MTQVFSNVFLNMTIRFFKGDVVFVVEFHLRVKYGVVFDFSMFFYLTGTMEAKLEVNSGDGNFFKVVKKINVPEHVYMSLLIRHALSYHNSLANMW